MYGTKAKTFYLGMMIAIMISVYFLIIDVACNGQPLTGFQGAAIFLLVVLNQFSTVIWITLILHKKEKDGKEQNKNDGT